MNPSDLYPNVGNEIILTWLLISLAFIGLVALLSIVFVRGVMASKMAKVRTLTYESQSELNDLNAQTKSLLNDLRDTQQEITLQVDNLHSELSSFEQAKEDLESSKTAFVEKMDRTEAVVERWLSAYEIAKDSVKKVVEERNSVVDMSREIESHRKTMEDGSQVILQSQRELGMLVEECRDVRNVLRRRSLVVSERKREVVLHAENAKEFSESCADARMAAEYSKNVAQKAAADAHYSVREASRITRELLGTSESVAEIQRLLGQEIDQIRAENRRSAGKVKKREGRLKAQIDQLAELLARAPRLSPQSVQSAATERLDAPINLNTSSFTELTKLTMVGRTRARAILSHREEQGFKKIDDLYGVVGLTQSVAKKILDHNQGRITV
ncbi:MAG: helix-hairpin-helix domain-containing protein [Pseudomonadota bacterium]